jgi:hypothetical protein
MLGHVRLTLGSDLGIPTDLQQTAAHYFEVQGILLEHVDGYTLEDIATSPAAPPPTDLKEWQQIIQSAANIAHDINKRGVLMQDCSPRNVVVDRHSQTPQIIELCAVSLPG